MKFLFWQFGLYALAAFALGFGAAWSWFRERLRILETTLERTRTRATESSETREQLRQARTAEREATEALVMLKARLQESELARSSADVEVESLRGTRLKLLAELSELRGHLDSVAVSNTRLTASEHETARLRAQLAGVDEQLRTERAAREHTMSLLQRRLLEAETVIASNRLASGADSTAKPGSSATPILANTVSESPELIVDLRRSDRTSHQTLHQTPYPTTPGRSDAPNGSDRDIDLTTREGVLAAVNGASVNGASIADGDRSDSNRPGLNHAPADDREEVRSGNPSSAAVPGNPSTAAVSGTGDV